MSSSSSSTNVVGVHYKVGRKLGEGSFGIIYEGKTTRWGVLKKKKDKFKQLFFVTGTNLLNNLQVAIKFEPRKSDAPQLRDEYRTYKILSGTGKLFLSLTPFIPLQLLYYHLFFSWNTLCVLFWSRRSSQYSCD